MMIDVGGPGQNVAVKLRQTRRRRLVTLKAGDAVLKEGLAGQAFKRVSAAIVAVKPAGLVALVEQKAQPGGGGLKDCRVDLGETLKKSPT